MKVVLITGSRAWENEDTVFSALDEAAPDMVIHGACPTGADDMASLWCLEHHHDVFELPMPAPWEKQGRRAGPLRNRMTVETLQHLAFCGHECEAHAFPLGKSPGTRGCMKLLEAAGFTVENHGS